MFDHLKIILLFVAIASCVPCIPYINFNFLRFKDFTNVKCEPNLLMYGYDKKVLFLDMVKSPHVLIAGSTGSGKSMCLRVIINNLLYNNVRLHLFDFKRVELVEFKSNKNVQTYITDKDLFLDFLQTLLTRVLNRYDVMAHHTCKNILEYNAKNPNKKFAFEYVVIDEFAYLKDSKKVMQVLEQILALSRACGIYFVLATQRPDKDVVTGNIKCNINNILGFKTNTAVNSRVIIDEGGLEKIDKPGVGIASLSGQLINFRGFYLE